MSNKMYHGDVILQKIASLPEGATEVAPVNGRLVLREGEVSGHAHVITDTRHAKTFSLANELFLLVAETVVIGHEEHLEGAVEPGLYHVRAAEEVDPFDKMTRRAVFD